MKPASIEANIRRSFRLTSVIRLAVCDIDPIERHYADEMLLAGLGAEMVLAVRQQRVRYRVLEPGSVRQGRSGSL
jgi:hypothetical protein